MLNKVVVVKRLIFNWKISHFYDYRNTTYDMQTT